MVNALVNKFFPKLPIFSIQSRIEKPIFSLDFYRLIEYLF
jgi:hypothetical protein